MSETILGTGLDLVECDRIRRSVEKFGERFLGRVFHAGERDYASRQRFPHRHLAARFAAKEAVNKAFGGRLGWKDMEIRRHASGEPWLRFHANGEKLLHEHGVGRVMISLTHTEHYAAATAILVSS
jgi:holo-[acyl-carrier protein] synthase